MAIVGGQIARRRIGRPGLFGRSMGVTRVLLSAALVSSVIAATIAFASTSLPALLGFKTMVVTSGSMEPSIGAGDAVVIRPASEKPVGVGDVITFGSIGGHGMVTHRVVSVREIDGRIYFQTRGDANATPDANLTAKEAVYGKVSLSLPKVGYLLDFIMTGVGKLLIIGLPLLILVAREVWRLPGSLQRP